MGTLINANLLLRLLNIQEFFTHQWLMIYPNDNQKLSELIKIKKHQLSLEELIMQQAIGGGEGGRGGTTIRGLRAKNDKNIRNPQKKSSSRTMSKR